MSAQRKLSRIDVLLGLAGLAGFTAACSSQLTMGPLKSPSKTVTTLGGCPLIAGDGCGGGGGGQYNFHDAATSSDGSYSHLGWNDPSQLIAGTIYTSSGSVWGNHSTSFSGSSKSDVATITLSAPSISSSTITVVHSMPLPPTPGVPYTTGGVTVTPGTDYSSAKATFTSNGNVQWQLNVVLNSDATTATFTATNSQGLNVNRTYQLGSPTGSRLNGAGRVVAYHAAAPIASDIAPHDLGVGTDVAYTKADCELLAKANEFVGGVALIFCATGVLAGIGAALGAEVGIGMIVHAVAC